MKDRLPKTTDSGEPHFNARRLKSKNFRGCRSGEAASGQEKLLGGCQLLTPHAPSGVRTQPAVEYCYKSVRTLYGSVDRVDEPAVQLDERKGSLRFAVIKLRLQMTDTLKRAFIPIPSAD